MTRVTVSGTTPPTIPSSSSASRGDLTGCPWHDAKTKLRAAGLRPTRQRMALGWILFAKGDRHVTAEMLYEEASQGKVPVALATVYNTLNLFTEVGLLRQVAVDGSKSYFDTNNSEHHHFYIEDQHELACVAKPVSPARDSPPARDQSSWGSAARSQRPRGRS
jgi:Fur family transcriptional regulator, iron response regulator